MSSTSSESELVVLGESENSDGGENGSQDVPGCNRRNLRYKYQQQRPRQRQESETKENSPPPSSKAATTNVNVLHEILEIVQWVNTGMKREGVREKTFMEKKFEEMEKALGEKEEQLEHALLEICVLKQIKTGLEVENGVLGQRLEMEKKEKAELKSNWMKMKASLQTLQVRYFEDVPSSSRRDGNHGIENGDDISRHEEARLQVPSGDLGSIVEATEAEPKSSGARSSSTGTQEGVYSFCEALLQLDDNVTEAGLGEREGQRSAASTINTLSSDRKRLKKRGSGGETKLHGVDASKQHLGAFCICGFKCSTKRALDSHIIYYTCERKFSCSICHQRFVGSNYLKGHMLRAHKVTYTGGMNGCRDCGKTFNTLLQLRGHKKLAHCASSNGSINMTKKTNPPKCPTRNRRSIRMRLRHQKGVEVNSALNMLKGNCNNCQFCRQQQNQSKSKQEGPASTHMPTCNQHLSTILL